MIALDTNVIVRLIARDDSRQVELAESVLGSGDVLVPMIALVESAWVLRTAHQYLDRDVAKAFNALFALENVSVENAAGVTWALERFRQGADLADMLLLVESRRAAEFATFDRQLAKRAGSLAPVPVRVLS